MDIFAHGLWTGVAFSTLRRSTKQRFSIRWAVFWGVIPDLFAFTLPFMTIIAAVLFGQADVSEFGRHTESAPHNFPLQALTYTLYNLSHSLVFFALVFACAYVFRKNVPLELGGWLLHIIVDIPTHSYDFFPTPFLWPISDFRVDGFSWGSPIFMTINYSLIAISIAVLYLTRRKQKNL